MVIEKCREIVENRHQYAKEWKAKTGGKVFGYFCCYGFEEIVYAAGILPVRILGRKEPQEVSAPYIYSSMWCPFSRNALAEGLLGHYDYLEGVFMGQSCHHIRQSFDAWRWYVNPDIFAWFVSVPHRVELPRVKVFVTEELKVFKKSLEEYTGKAISNEALEKAIKVYDTNRRLMKKLYELRKSEPPVISGAEAMEISLASQMMDKEEHNRLLEQALEELPKREDKPESGVRLMVMGGEIDDPDMLRVIERQGANIVTDDLCIGTRYYWAESVPEEDPLAQIAGRYMLKPSCPVKDTDHHRRKAHISKLVDEYKVQAVWVIRQKFCDPHEFDNPVLKKWLLEEKSIPSYEQELDTTIPEGQLATRAGAFLEQFTLEFV